MKLKEIETQLGYRPLIEDYDRDGEFRFGFTSDLLSDAMANCPEDSVFVTIQAHKNSVAVASLVGVSAIIACSGHTATEDMLFAAADEEIAVFSTEDDQFTVSWKLHRLLEGGK